MTVASAQGSSRKFLSAPQISNNSFIEKFEQPTYWSSGFGRPPGKLKLELQQDHFRKFVASESYSDFLHFLVRQQPDQRFVVQIDYLNPVAKRIVKIATESGDQFQAVLLCDFFPNLRELPFIAHHDSEVSHPVGPHFLDLEHREELVRAEFEKSVTFAFVEFFEVENVLVKRDCFCHVSHFDGDVVAAIDLHAHKFFRANVRCQAQLDGDYASNFSNVIGNSRMRFPVA
jgi:hypothetical protein